MTGLKSTSDAAPGLIRMQRVRLAGLLTALATAAWLAAFAGRLFAEPLFDRYQRWQPRQITETRVHVVRIDAESLRALGPWPWPRSYLALLTDRIREAGAVAIGYDIVFAEPDPATDPARTADLFGTLSPAVQAEIAALPSLDARFGRSLGAAPTVVARVGVMPGAIEAQGRSRDEAGALFVEAKFAGAVPESVTRFPFAIGNVADIEDSARGQGLINGNPDADGVTRRLVMLARVGGNPTPGISVDLVRVATRRRELTAAPNSLVVGDHRIPLTAAGEAWLHFGILPDGSETSAVNMMRQQREPGRLKGKIVLIGPASTGLGDVRVTPLGRQEFGVRLHAQAVDAILGNGWLVRPTWAPVAEWVLGAVLAVLAIWGLPVARRRALWPLLAVVLVFGFSLAAFAAARLLLDPLRPLLLGGTTALAVLAVLFAETGRVARQLREARLAADGEMKAAREIQQAMLPDRATLAGLHPRLDLDAVLEPAQAIGGDLYDAFALPDGRVVFLVGDVTGKGPSAALFMAVSKALAHSLLRRGGVPLNAIIEALNDELVESSASVAEVTMLCGIIDPVSGRIELVNAGHENPLLKRADGSVGDVPMDGGLPLCTAAGFPYPLESVDLAPGDALVIITDGVREAQNAAGDFFGSERTRDVLRQWPAAVDAIAATRTLVSAVRGFEAGNPASDDLTVMVVARRAGGDDR
jgi:serine phosphatase RsbU (regulator of sigma subunit)/CHASE2 domain-containing sensor protein